MVGRWPFSWATRSTVFMASCTSSSVSVGRVTALVLVLGDVEVVDFEEAGQVGALLFQAVPYVAVQPAASRGAGWLPGAGGGVGSNRPGLEPAVVAGLAAPRVRECPVGGVQLADLAPGVAVRGH